MILTSDKMELQKGLSSSQLRGAVILMKISNNFLAKIFLSENFCFFIFQKRASHYSF